MARAGQDSVEVWLDRTPSHGNDLGARYHTLQRLEVDNLDRDMHIWREPLDQCRDPIRIRGPGSENFAAKPNRVLYRVKAL